MYRQRQKEGFFSFFKHTVKNNVYRRNVAQEILKTEEVYVNNLDILYCVLPNNTRFCYSQINSQSPSRPTWSLSSSWRQPRRNSFHKSPTCFPTLWCVGRSLACVRLHSLSCFITNPTDYKKL